MQVRHRKHDYTLCIFVSAVPSKWKLAGSCWNMEHGTTDIHSDNETGFLLLNSLLANGWLYSWLTHELSIYCFYYLFLKVVSLGLTPIWFQKQALASSLARALIMSHVILYV